MKIIKFIIFIGLMGLLGAALGYSMVNNEWAQLVIPAKGEMSMWYILYIILSFFIVLTVHELGHLLTGLYHGFSFEMFTVAFLGIKRDENRKIKIYLNKDMNAFGGLAATIPVEEQADNMSKMAKVILGGPISSVLFSVLMFAIFSFVGQPLKFICFVTGIMSIFIFLSVMIPSTTGMFYTDRKRYQRLTSEGIERQIEMAYIKAQLCYTAKKPITTMDVSELELITQDESALFKYIGYFYIIDYYKEDDSKQDSYLQSMRALEKDLPKSFVKAMQPALNELSQRD